MSTPEHQLAPAAARAQFRAGLRRPTSGFSAGYAQANLLAVPQALAFDMLLFAQRNPKSCPVLGVLEAGQLEAPLLAGGDIRTDIPAYRVYREGELVAEPDDVLAHWRDDLVAFLIGCSFTFEAPLLEAGVPIRHMEQGVNVPMYRTSVRCEPAGALSGPMVVSMRPLPADRIADASGSPPAIPGCMVPRCTSGRLRRSASATSPPPTSEMRWRSRRDGPRCSGPAASRPRRR